MSDQHPLRSPREAAKLVLEAAHHSWMSWGRYTGTPLDEENIELLLLEVAVVAQLPASHPVWTDPAKHRELSDGIDAALSEHYARLAKALPLLTPDEEQRQIAELLKSKVNPLLASPEQDFLVSLGYRGRLRSCVEKWSDAASGKYDPACCRFPKSCSADVWLESVPDEEIVP